MLQPILYIDKKLEKTPLLYRDLVNCVIKQGIEPTAAYIYLAGMGIRSRNCRVSTGDGWSPIYKIAVKNDQPIMKVTITPPEIEVIE